MDTSYRERNDSHMVLADFKCTSQIQFRALGCDLRAVERKDQSSGIWAWGVT